MRAMALAIFLSLIVGAGASASGTFLSPGNPAPSAQLVTSDGHPVSFDQVRGQGPVVLWFTNFSPATESSVASLIEVVDRFKSRGVRVVAVNLNGSQTGSAVDFANRHGASVTVLNDPTGQACQAFTGEYLQGTVPMHNLFVIGGDGLVRGVHRFPGCPPRVLEGELAQLP